MKYPELTLPQAPLKITEADSQVYVFDVLRKKNIVLTPEEWVRQHLIYFIHQHLKVPFSLMGIERGLTVNKLAKRTDLIIYKPDGSLWMLVECKAPQVVLNEQVMKQIANYNKILQSKYLFITNGMNHFIFQKDDEKMYQPIQNLPDWSE
jgi:hypothetical protein